MEQKFTGNPIVVKTKNVQQCRQQVTHRRRLSSPKNRLQRLSADSIILVYFWWKYKVSHNRWKHSIRYKPERLAFEPTAVRSSEDRNSVKNRGIVCYRCCACREAHTDQYITLYTSNHVPYSRMNLYSFCEFTFFSSTSSSLGRYCRTLLGGEPARERALPLPIIQRLVCLFLHWSL